MGGGLDPHLMKSLHSKEDLDPFSRFAQPARATDRLTDTDTRRYGLVGRNRPMMDVCAFNAD